MKFKITAKLKNEKHTKDIIIFHIRNEFKLYNQNTLIFGHLKSLQRFLLLVLIVIIWVALFHQFAALLYQKVSCLWKSAQISPMPIDFPFHFIQPSYPWSSLSAWQCYLSSIFEPPTVCFPFGLILFIDLPFLFFSRTG